MGVRDFYALSIFYNRFALGESGKYGCGHSYPVIKAGIKLRALYVFAAFYNQTVVSFNYFNAAF